MQKCSLRYLYQGSTNETTTLDAKQNKKRTHIVDMGKRINCKSSLPTGSIVPKLSGSKTVSKFMHRHSKKDYRKG